MYKPCNNPDCSVSTGIHGGLTFGNGELDDYGYWEHPCHLCARDFEHRHRQYGPCWPFNSNKTEKENERQ